MKSVLLAGLFVAGLVGVWSWAAEARAQAAAGIEPLDTREKAEAALGLKLAQVDFIDCTKDDSGHPFMDQGTSSVVDGPAGRYRVTAAHRHAFFSYRFKAAGKDKPILLVVEYPDDAVRNICFFTHESKLSGAANIDWSLETGVYTGDPLPLSNRMQYHTFIYWPQEDEPAVIVGNWNRYGSNGAASRIWIYSIDGGLPKLAIHKPDTAKQRVVGHYNSIHFLPTDFYYGFRSPNAIEHMLDYAEYVGVNELSWSVVYNNSWGFSCRIPSWDGGDKSDHLDKVLEAMDARPGMTFVAGFALGEGFKIGGKPVEQMSNDEVKTALVKGFEEFVDRYGKHKSLRGIAIGAMFGIETIDLLREKGAGEAVVAAIKAKKPDLEVLTYVGGRHLHEPYFYGGSPDKGDTTPSAWDVVDGWSASGQSWSDWLGTEADKAWKAWKHDPAELKKIKGLTVYEQLQPDDFRIFGLYAQEPRAEIYYDLERSQKRSDLVGSDHAAMWNTHFEGWFGLAKDYNFWWRKLWVAPDFLPPQDLAMAPFANALALRDRMAVIPGSWNNRYFGHEAMTRRWSKALRSLPPVDMKDIKATGADTARVRWVEFNGKRHVAVISVIPFSQAVFVGGNKVTLRPYGVASLADTGSGEPKAEVVGPEDYRQFVADRIAEFRKLVDEVRAADAEAAPPAYTQAADQAAKLLADGRPYAADIAVGAGLVNEMRLRKAILNPPQLVAAKVASAPPMNGDLGAWPKGAADIRAEGGEFIAGHLYFPNSWHGPTDLSARVRLANDGEKLYVGLAVKDKDLVAYQEESRGRPYSYTDAAVIRLSTDGAYMNWRGTAQKGNISWSISLPIATDETSGKGAGGFSYTCRRTAEGYVMEGSAPLADLKLKPGGTMGFLVMLTDVDKSPNMKAAGWAAKQAMLIPHRPTFEYWGDARTLGQLVVGE